MDFPKVRVLTATALGVFSSIALAQFPTTSGPSGVPVDPPLSSPSAIVLYDQTDNPSLNVTSQDFEAANDGFDAEAADDFVVPTGSIWRVTGAFVPGSYTTGPAAAVNLTFAVDAAGLPGGTVRSYPLQTPADAAGSFTFTLPTPCVLMPGKYWMIVQTRQDFGTAGQWFWNTRSVQSNAGAAWRNPGNGFATGCTSFSPLTTCLPSSGGPDMNFSISGTPGGVSPPTPAECGSSTSYFETLAPVPIPDEGGPVATSTILVSGLSGPIWDLNVVTEIVHGTPGDLDITIQSPAGTVVTLSTDNGIDNDDVFNGTAWDDQGNPGGQVPYVSNSGLVNDHSYTTGVAATLLAPEEALAAFIGENPNGTWTITIDDDTAAVAGTLNGWGLQITTRQGEMTTSVLSTPSNATPVPIPESGGPTAVSTIDASTHLGSFVRRIRPTINITHTWPADLDVTLMSPSGKIVTLTSDNGAGNDNVFAGTLFDDAANPGGQIPYVTNNGLAGDTAYVALVPVPTLVSEEALALFVGEDPRGIWTLTIDDDEGMDVGTLNSWSLEITTCTCAAAEPDNPVRVDEHASSGSSNLNGVFETGETVRFEPAWFNPGATAFDLSFAISQNFTGPAGPTYSILDDSASYGGLAPGATANCFDASGNCYDLSIASASRPTQHWDASIRRPRSRSQARKPRMRPTWPHSGTSTSVKAFRTFRPATFSIGSSRRSSTRV